MCNSLADSGFASRVRSSSVALVLLCLCLYARWRSIIQMLV